MFEFLAWIRIVLASFIIAVILGWICYIYNAGLLGIFLGIGIPLVGLVMGIRWANRIARIEGTMHFISRLDATEELDPKERPQKQHSERKQTSDFSRGE